MNMYHTHSMQKAYLSKHKIRDIKKFYNDLTRMTSVPDIIRLMDTSTRYNNDDWSGLVDLWSIP